MTKSSFRSRAIEMSLLCGIKILILFFTAINEYRTHTGNNPFISYLVMHLFIQQSYEALCTLYSFYSFHSFIQSHMTITQRGSVGETLVYGFYESSAGNGTPDPLITFTNKATCPYFHQTIIQSKQSPLQICIKIELPSDLQHHKCEK